MSIKIELFDPAVPSTNPTSTPVTFAVEEYTREIVEVYAPAAVAVGGGSEGVAEHLTDPNPHPQYFRREQPIQSSTSGPDGTSTYALNHTQVVGQVTTPYSPTDDPEVVVRGKVTWSSAANGFNASQSMTQKSTANPNYFTSVSQDISLSLEGIKAGLTQTVNDEEGYSQGFVAGTSLKFQQEEISNLTFPVTGEVETPETLATREWADGQYVPASHTDETGAKHAAANISFTAGGTLSAGTVQSGIIALDARVTNLQKPTTYTTALTSERERLDLNFALVTTSSDLKAIYNNSKKVSWDNEWGALRGTSPYSWGDALVRGIRENSDGITNGQFLQLEDRRTGAPNPVLFGVNWTDGSIVRNGNRMADVWYRANSSVAIPANLPVGTIVITGSA